MPAGALSRSVTADDVARSRLVPGLSTYPQFLLTFCLSSAGWDGLY